MRTFRFTSKAFEGGVIITYNERSITIDAGESNLNDNQLMYLGQSIYKIGFNPDKLGSITEGSTQGAKIVEITKVPTFQEFWDRYFKDRYKDNSSKKRSEVIWNRFSNSSKCASVSYISKYFSNIRPGVEIKLAETYLSQEIWEQ
jgi:hypothetical protein